MKNTHINFNGALEAFGDMMNAEVTGLGISAETALYRVIEMGPAGAAIHSDFGTKTPNYRMDSMGIQMAKWVWNLSHKNQEAILARYAIWEFNTDSKRAEYCGCTESGYRTRLTRARKALKRKYKAWKHKIYAERLKNDELTTNILISGVS